MYHSLIGCCFEGSKRISKILKPTLIRDFRPFHKMEKVGIPRQSDLAFPRDAGTSELSAHQKLGRSLGQHIRGDIVRVDGHPTRSLSITYRALLRRFPNPERSDGSTTGRCNDVNQNNRDGFKATEEETGGSVGCAVVGSTMSTVGEVSFGRS